MRRAPAVTPLAALNRVAARWPGGQLRWWFDAESNAYPYGRRRPLLERVFPAPVEGEPIFARCGLGEASDKAVPAGRSASLQDVFEGILRWSGAHTIVSKRIAHNRRVAALAAAFPAARFAVVTRDGRAVAYSLSKVDWWEGGTVWWFGGTPEQWRAQGGDPWELCARTWIEEVRAIEAGLAALPARQIFRLRYEDLVANPLEQLAALATFGGLPASARWRVSLSRLRFPNRNESWKATLQADVIERIGAIQSQELSRYDYI